MKQFVVFLGTAFVIGAVIATSLLAQKKTGVPASAQETIQPPQLAVPTPSISYVGNQVIVKYKQATSDQGIVGKRTKTYKRFGVKKTEKLLLDFQTPAIELETFKQKYGTEIASNKRHVNEPLALKADLSRTYKISIESTSPMDEIIEELLTDPDVEGAEPVYVASSFMTPNDPLYSQQWAHTKTGVATAWDKTIGSKTVKIAVIDTGVDVQHEDLKSSLLADCTGGCPADMGYDFVDIDVNAYAAYGTPFPEEDYTVPDALPADFDGHGTHVAGIIAAAGNNNTGVIGVCPGCALMPVRAGFTLLGSFGGHLSLLESDDIVNAIVYATDNGAHIISMSFGGRQSMVMTDALNYAASRGVVLIAAAGNSNWSLTDASYPASDENVIAVSATTSQDTKASFSNWGNWIDIAAPGENILSTIPKIGPKADASGYRQLSGTSMAAPYVSGVAGLLLSYNPLLTSKDVVLILKQETDTLAESTYYIGEGKIHADKVLNKAIPIPAITAQISSPQQDAYVNGTVSFIGNSTGATYELVYGAGYYPISWSQITSATGARQGELGQLDTAALSEGLYTARLISRTGAAYVIASRSFTIDRLIHAGWPKQIQTALFASDKDNANTPLIADIDTDGVGDILMHNSSADYVFAGTGSLLSGWPTTWHPPQYGWVYQTPSLTAGDMDNDCVPEVAASSTNSTSTSCFNLYTNTGTPKNSSWPKACTAQFSTSGEPFYKPPIMYDVNGDGTRELIMLEGKRFLLEGVNQSRIKIHIFTVNGTELPGWPVEMAPEYDFEGVHIAAGDINGDGTSEIIAFTVSRVDVHSLAHLFIWNNNGTLLSGYPKNVTKPTTEQITGFYNTVVIGNFDADLQREMPVITNPGSCFFENYGRINYLNLDTGTFSPVTSRFTDRFIENKTSNTTAVGDVNKDGVPEIVFGTSREECQDQTQSRVYVFSSNQSAPFAGWPQLVDGDVVSQPAIGDITGDGNPDVLVVTTTAKVYAWHNTGVLINGFPRRMQSGHTSSSGIAIGDVDGDSKVEIVAATNQGYVYVWDMDAPFAASSLAWPMHNHDQFQSNNTFTSLTAPPLPSSCTITASPTPTIIASPTPTGSVSPTPVPVLNILKNASFELDTNNDTIPDSWRFNSKTSEDRRTNSTFIDGNYSVQISCSKNTNKVLKQTIEGNWASGTSFTFSGYSKGQNIAAGSQKGDYRVILNYADGTFAEAIHVLPPGTHNWTPSSFAFTAGQKVKSILVALRCGKQSGKIYFDATNLRRDTTGTASTATVQLQKISSAAANAE